VHRPFDPEARITRAEVEAAIDVAIEWETATVCCRPADLPLVVSKLRRSVVGPTTVIGFPHGAHMSQIKEREALVAVDQGAVELDVVINIGALRSGDLGYVRDELASLVYAVGPTPVKVILETAYLTPEEVEAGCRVVLEARGAFVKNGTGYFATGRRTGRDRADAPGRRRSRGGQSRGAFDAGRHAGDDRRGSVSRRSDGYARDRAEWRARGPEAIRAIIAAAPAPKAAAGPASSEDE